MSKNLPLRRSFLATAALLCGGLASVATVTGIPATQAAVPASVLIQTGGFADLVEQVMPAVVNIAAKQPVTRTNRNGAQARSPVAQGSGFVIDPSGYVVTNAHVVGRSQDVVVTLQDGTELAAKVVGTDTKTDIALLKVEPKRPLTHVEFGDSDAARVGDPVVAIGTPFGLGGTVTAGILSARARNIGSGPYDDYLQIDAPINRGNSGGPTFTLDGKVVGINTAIFSPSGGSVGIGFAIPANQASWVVGELREHGVVNRSWLGVQIQSVTPDVAEGLGRPDLKGALIAGLVPNGPAQRANMQVGDVIVEVAGEPILDVRDVTRRITEAEAGTAVGLTVLRDGRKRALQVVVDSLPEQPELVPASRQ